MRTIRGPYRTGKAPFSSYPPLLERCLDTCRGLLGLRSGSETSTRGGRKAHRIDVWPEI